MIDKVTSNKPTTNDDDETYTHTHTKICNCKRGEKEMKSEIEKCSFFWHIRNNQYYEMTKYTLLFVVCDSEGNLQRKIVLNVIPKPTDQTTKLQYWVIYIDFLPCIARIFIASSTLLSDEQISTISTMLYYISAASTTVHSIHISTNQRNNIKWVDWRRRKKATVVSNFVFFDQLCVYVKW